MKHEYAITGLTTAASVWVAAVIGICLGAGEYVIGIFVFGCSSAVITVIRVLQDFIWDTSTRGVLVACGLVHLQSLFLPLCFFFFFG